MSNLQRIIWFDAQIRAERYPSTRTLAERFEISIRQATRDIEYLRDSLGAPLEYCPPKRGYRYERSTFVLPSVFVTEEQRSDLERLSQYYQQMPDQRGVHLAELFRRLSLVNPSHLAARPVDITPMSQPLGPYIVEVSFAAPQMVDLTAVKATLLPDHYYRLELSSLQQLLLILVACPTPFVIRSPVWVKNRMRSLLERTLRSL